MATARLEPPSWAKWLAKENSGDIYYYEVRPARKESCWLSVHGTRCMLAGNTGGYVVNWWNELYHIRGGELYRDTDPIRISNL